MLGLAVSVAKGGASLLTYVKDNLRLYLDFKSSRSDTLAFPSEGSTSFDGSGDVIDFGNITDINNATNLTMVMWVKRLESNDAVTFEKSSGSNHRVSINLWTDNKVYANLATGSGGALGSCDLSGTDWNHIGYVFDGTQADNASRLKLYINGVAQTLSFSGTIPSSIPSDTGTVKIGRDTANSTDSTGSVCNSGIWTRSLSEQEIQSVMNKSYSQLGSVEKTSLVMWQSLDSANNAIGNELTTNSGFDTDTGWTKETGWTISDGVAVANNAGATFTLYQTASSTIYGNKTYRVTYTITEFTSSPSGMKIRIGGSLYGTARTAVGTYTEDITTNSSIGNQGIGFYSTGANNTLKIDNVSFKELNMSEDSHGSNHGTSIGATTTTSVYGGNAPILPRAIDIAESFADAIGDGSALFNGSSDYIDLGDSTDFDITNSITLSSWVNFNSTSTNIILARDDNTNENFILYGWSDGKIYGQIRIGGVGKTVDGGTYSLNVWYHVALTYDGSSLKIYVNGILQDTLSASGSIDNDDVSFEIGRKGNNSFHFDGKISQVGIWQGALSQNQVQSLMESTSYAKIPADVKSTLGGELVGNNTSSGWLAYGDNTVANVTNGVKITHDDNTGGADGRLHSGYLLNSDTTSGKIYKVVFNAYYSGGTAPNVKIWTGSETAGIQALTTTETEHIIYYVATGSTASLFFDSVNGSQEIFITNLSAKEVTNDLVAYYPLDADSSRGNGTDDVTTGEVLGDNLATVTTFANQSAYGQVNIIPSSVADGNGLYKISYTVDSYTSGNFQYQSNSGTQPTPALGYTRGTSTGDKVDYIFINNAGTHFQFRAFNLGYTGSISNIQIRKVTSNTGVLL